MGKKKKRKVQLNLFIPLLYRDLLRRMAAEQVLRDPENPSTGASVATAILINALDHLQMREGPSDEQHSE